MWLMAGRMLRIAIGILVLGSIGEYLGPENFGRLNFAVGLTTIFAALATLGFEGIVIRELVRLPEKTADVLGSAFCLRFAGASLAFLSVLGAAPWAGDTATTTLSLLIALAFFPGAGDVLELWLQKNIDGKAIFYVRTAAALVSAAVRLGLVAAQAPLSAFALVYTLEVLLGVIGFLILYLRRGGNIYLWRIDRDIVSRLVRDSLPLILAGLLIALYARMEQLLVKAALGDYVLGVYYASIRISEVWAFLPAAILSTVYPFLVMSRDSGDPEAFANRTQVVFDAITGLGYVVAVSVSVAAPFVIPLIFGEAYRAAVPVLIIQAWTAPIMFSGAARAQFFLIENLNIYHTFSALIGIAINIPLAWWLMGKLGAPGAAVAAMIAAWVSACGTSWIFPRLRPCAAYQNRAFLLPFRLRTALRQALSHL